MALKRLIENQKIRVDRHKSGAINPGDLKGVHIHKTFIGNQRAGKWVKIDITGENISFDKRLDDKDSNKIIREIEAVIEHDRKKLIELADYFSDALWRWSNHEVRIEDAKRYAQHIAEQFGLSQTIKEEFSRKVGENLERYVTTHTDEQNRVYTIDQSAKRVVIVQGKVYLQKRHI